MFENIFQIVTPNVLLPNYQTLCGIRISLILFLSIYTSLCILPIESSAQAPSPCTCLRTTSARGRRAPPRFAPMAVRTVMALTMPRMKMLMVRRVARALLPRPLCLATCPSSPMRDARRLCAPSTCASCSVCRRYSVQQRGVPHGDGGKPFTNQLVALILVFCFEC